MVTGVSHSLFYKLCLLAELNRRSEKNFFVADRKKVAQQISVYGKFVLKKEQVANGEEGPSK